MASSGVTPAIDAHDWTTRSFYFLELGCPILQIDISAPFSSLKGESCLVYGVASHGRSPPIRVAILPDASRACIVVLSHHLTSNPPVVVSNLFVAHLPLPTPLGPCLPLVSVLLPCVRDPPGARDQQHKPHHLRGGFFERSSGLSPPHRTGWDHDGFGSQAPPPPWPRLEPVCLRRAATAIARRTTL